MVLLLILGWLVKMVSATFSIPFPDLEPLLPILGSVGLILIVLEGSLELELDRGKRKLVFQSVFSAFAPIVLISIVLAWFISSNLGYPLRICLINVLPLAVISSSIAISAGRNLNRHDREFVTYESSLSDIFGVLIFNFLVINETLSISAVSVFGLQFLLVLAISFGSTLLLAFLLGRINHHIKFAPIILLVILIYEISKVYHLPALIFILIFGLFLGNFDRFKNIGWIRKFNPQTLNTEVHKLKEIVAEATFLIRALFFLLFGFLIENSEILNLTALSWSVPIVAGIFIIRAVILKFAGARLQPLVYIAPRGLITILLYFAVEEKFRIDIINESLVLQVILLTSLIMMVGMMISGRPAPVLSERHENV